LRRVRTSSWVDATFGACFGVTTTTAALYAGLGMGGDTDATSGTLPIAATSFSTFAISAARGRGVCGRELHRDEERCVRPDTEIVRDEVVGPALGQRRRHVAVVGEAELHVQQGRREDGEQDQRHRDAHARPVAHAVGEAIPEPAHVFGFLDVTVLAR